MARQPDRDLTGLDETILHLILLDLRKMDQSELAKLAKAQHLLASEKKVSLEK